jgi:hypothetical protein
MMEAVRGLIDLPDLPKGRWEAHRNEKVADAGTALWHVRVEGSKEFVCGTGRFDEQGKHIASFIAGAHNMLVALVLGTGGSRLTDVTDDMPPEEDVLDD